MQRVRRHLLLPTVITGIIGAAAGSASRALAAGMSDVLGASNINPGYYFTTQDAVNEATNQLVGMGSTTVKLEMGIQDINTTWSDGSIIYPGQTSPPPPSKYAWNTPTWPAKSTLSLVNLAQTTYFSKAFSNPTIKNYVITTYSPNVPSSGGDGTEFWLNGMTASEKAAETASFYNYTKYLLQTYNGTGKTFYLENWEGDWALKDPGRNTQPSPTAVQGMIDWFNARQAGINEAKHDFGAASNVKVYQTIEVNRVADAINGDVFNGQTGWATVTNDVLPYTNVDFASYSSYDTQQVTSGATSYASAVQYLANHLPATAVNGQNTHSVYVGEFGLAEDSAGITTVNNMMNNVLNTVKADGMPMALYWEVYSNEIKSETGLPAGNSGDNSNTKGFYFVKPDGTPATAWNQYRYLLSNSDPTQSSTAAIVRNGGLHLAYASDFTKTGATLGAAWTTNNSGGAMSVGITNGQVQMSTVNGSATPTGQATLNLVSALGRGLNPGEYVQFTLNRQQDAGIVGFSAFGLNHGSGIGAGNQPLNVFSSGINSTGGTWHYISFNPTGTTAAPSTTYSWNTADTLGLKLLSADGNFATIAYYVNGSYSGSWLYPTTAKTLDSFSLFAQSNTTGNGFGFNNLSIYTTGTAAASTAYQWDPTHNLAGGSGTWDGSTTANFSNGSADTTWNNATLADNVTFGGTAGTVTVSGNVTASTLKFATPNYTLSGGTITMMGNQTINATSGNATINSVIAGNTGVTITGAGSVTLGGNNTFTGGVFVTGGGTAAFATDANLGGAGQPITLDGGTLSYTGTTAPTLTRAITINAGGGTINNVGNGATGKFTLSGTNLINGSGNLTKAGPGWLTLFGSNTGTFTGNWTISGGVLEVGTASLVGTGSIAVNAGAELVPSNGTVLTNAITVAGGTIGADNATGGFAGPITVTAASNVRLGNFWNATSQSTNITGNLSGSGKLTTVNASGAVTSTGKLTLSGDNSAFTGGFAVPTGTLVAGLSRSNTLGTGGITLSGGKLALQGQQTPTGTPAAAAAVAVTGFNKDVIYGNPDSSSFSTNTSGLDNVFGFYQTGYTPQFNPTTTIQNAGTQLSSGGLPGQNITSALAGSKPFSFQSFMANNALAIAKGSTGTLSLSTPAAFANLSLLASSTNAADDTPNVTINFADGGSVTTTYKAYDWFIGTDTLRQNASVFGAAGVFRYSASTAPGWDQRAFGLYESDIDLTNINGVDYSKRPIASLTFAATSATNGQTDVFAVSGAARAWANGASQSYANNVSVTADSGIDVSGSLAATLGTLNIGSNKLSVTSADATSSPYSLSFGATTVSGAATIDVAPSTGGGVGTVTLGNVSGGGSITKTNTGTLKFAGTTNAISGNLAINGGNAVVAFSPGGGATPASLSVALLSFSGGKLDLTDNKLFTTLPVANVKSAMSANTLFTSSTGGVLGYMDTGSGTTEVRFTLPGDTNLDGAVDVADLGALATSYGTTAGALWAQGDANGDGAVNVADLGLVATNYGQSIGAGTVDASSAAVASSTAVVAGSASVPEPTSLGLIGGLSIAVAARRRRR